MPAKKTKRKPKYTDGVLCRDSDTWGYVVFYPKLERTQVELVAKFRQWDVCEGDCPRQRAWTLKEWKAIYDLAPPRKGRCFEAEVEL